jgi:hypothetical protein
MAAVGWELIDGSLPIHTIIPKEDSVVNADACRKEERKSKSRPIIKCLMSDKRQSSRPPAFPYCLFTTYLLNISVSKKPDF